MKCEPSVSVATPVYTSGGRQCIQLRQWMRSRSGCGGRASEGASRKNHSLCGELRAGRHLTNHNNTRARKQRSKQERGDTRTDISRTLAAIIRIDRRKRRASDNGLIVLRGRSPARPPSPDSVAKGSSAEEGKGAESRSERESADVWLDVARREEAVSVQN